jgi:hypothetical protein
MHLEADTVVPELDAAIREVERTFTALRAARSKFNRCSKPANREAARLAMVEAEAAYRIASDRRDELVQVRNARLTQRGDERGELWSRPDGVSGHAVPILPGDRIKIWSPPGAPKPKTVVTVESSTIDVGLRTAARVASVLVIELRALMHEQLALDRRLQTVLDGLLEPTTTGYLHREESWSIAIVRAGEYGVEMELGLDPPDGAHEWSLPTIERMQELQHKLGADRVYAFPLERGKVRCFAQYNRRENK